MTTCVDCGGAAVFGIFDGAWILRVCSACSVRRSHGAVPDFALPGEGWVVGHAVQTDRLFRHCDQSKMYARGCFRQACEDDSIVMAVNHACVRVLTYGPTGYPKDISDIDWRHVIASTRDQTLIIAEDVFGLFFAASFPTTACVLYTNADPLNIHQAIARGECPGLSCAVVGGDRIVGRRGLPVDALVFVRAPVVEISLMLPPETGASDTNSWVLRAGPAAMTVLYKRLRAAKAYTSEGVSV